MGVLFQIIILFVVKTQPISDSKYYIDSAKRLFQTGSYITPGGKLTSFWPVGLSAYLAFLMFFTSHFIFLAKVFNILIYTSFVVILYHLFKNELNVKSRVVFLTAFIFFPNNLFSSNCILTEYPFTFLLWLAVYLIIKKENNLLWVGIISLILGLMCYLRPVGLFLPLVFAAYIIIHYGLIDSLKKVSVLITVFLITVAPWTYRNYMVFHEIIPMSTEGGFNFLMGNHDNSSGGVNFNFKYNTNVSESEASREAYIEGINDIIAKPFAAVMRLPKKIFFSYDRDDSSVIWSMKVTRKYIPPTILSLIFFFTNYTFYLILLISIITVITKRKIFQDSRLKYFASSLYVYFILIILIYVGVDRYIIPLLPIHFLIVGKYFS